MGKTFLVAALLTAICACSTKKITAGEGGDFFKRIFSKDTYKIYRIDIQQGNNITAVQLKKLKRGLSKEQVRYLLGTTITPTLFRQNRWDYTYYFISGTSSKRKKYSLSLFFDDNVLVQICQTKKDSRC